MKKIVLEVKNYNWGLIGPNSWKEKDWIIFDDMSVCYTIIYNSLENSQKMINFELNKNKFDIIMNDIESVKNDKTTVDASDGEAWEFIRYSNGVEDWRRDIGYIYGISPLENIADILSEEIK